MKNKAKSLFDDIADAYYTFTPTIPQKYITFLVKTFHLTAKDRIIDLGCGSGDLALALQESRSSVEGIDISKTMIAMAKEKDTQHDVRWIQKPVETFNFGKDKYDFMISFESFHLFPNKKTLIQHIAAGLKPGGALCIGWRMFAFDIPIKDMLEKTYAKYNIPYEWGYWTCPDFTTLVTQSNVKFYPVEQKSIKIQSKIKTKNIINYLLHLSTSASFSDDLKEKISHDLTEVITKLYPTGECVGYDDYTIMYCKKI